MSFKSIFPPSLKLFICKFSKCSTNLLSPEVLIRNEPSAKLPPGISLDSIEINFEISFKDNLNFEISL